MNDFVGSYLNQKVITIEGETSEEYRFNCPFHEDTVASAGFNKEKEIWRCFTCDIGGNIVDFESRIRKISEQQAEKFLAIYRGTKPTVPEKEVLEKHQVLVGQSEILQRLAIERNININIVNEFKLGWESGRLWIPIYFGEFVINVKRWDVFWKDEKDLKKKKKRKENKILPYSKGYSMEAIFPYSNRDKKSLLYTEGEGDCLASISSGIPAITVGSSASDLSNYVDVFKNKSIYLAYDLDDTGRRSSQSNATRLSRAGIKVKCLDISRVGATEKEDLTDVLVKHEKTLQDIDELISKTEWFGSKEKLTEDLTVYDIEFNDLPKDENYNKWVKVKLVLSGQEEIPKYIPKSVKFTCIGKQTRKCHYCSLNAKREIYKIDLNKDTENGLNIYYGNKHSEKLDLMNYFNIQCGDFEFNIVESQIVSMVFLVPLNSFKVTAKMTFVNGFTGKVHEDFNQIYRATAKIIKNPKSNDLTLWIKHLESISTMEFNIDEDFMERHRVFQDES